MKKLVKRFAPAVVPIAAALLMWAADTPSSEERLAQHRNLGKAFYENPTTHVEAVAEFKRALDLAPDSNREKLNYGLALLQAGKLPEGVAQLKEVQRKDPSLPATWFNLGIYYKKAGEQQQATAQFERMVALVPGHAISEYQLGTLYKQAGRAKDALARFERAAQLDPRLVAAHFQLFNMYRQLGRAQEAARELQIFQTLKKQAEGSVIPEDVEWSSYSEIYDPPDASRAPSGPAPSAVEPSFQHRILDQTVDAQTAGLAVIDSTGTGQSDLLAWSSQGIHLYRRGVDLVNDSGLGDLRGVIFVAPGDFDNDGLMDLCVLTATGPQLYRNTKGRFVKYAASLPQQRFERAVWIDYDHDYDLDLALLGDTAMVVRNEGSAGFAQRAVDIPFIKSHAVDAVKLRTVPDSKAFDFAVFYSDHPAALYRDQLGGRYTVASFDGKRPDYSTIQADFDSDGRLDSAHISPDGKIDVALNRAKSAGHWIRVQLQGVKSLRLAQDAVVEIKTGTLYRKQTYYGVPLLFDVGGYDTVDTVRVTWANGLIQNEVKQAVNQSHVYKEAPRLSGSCPMIWTWNGNEIQFITDVLGVAPLGVSDGDGSFFETDHDEYISIPSSALVPADGKYDVRVTEELSEVSYLDQIALYAIDHPSATEIFTNDKFKAPPFAEFRLFGVNRRIYPKSAVDDAGNNVLPRLIAKDETYPDQFERTDSGVAKMHTLELDFGNAVPSGHAELILNGWFDWPDGSIFRAAAQEFKGGLVMPSLQMEDENGHWKTVNEDMGMPSGKPKTIAVDLRFISARRKIRIVTNMCIYWDEIFLDENVAEPHVAQRQIPLTTAELHFRGFSAIKSRQKPGQPDAYLYDQISPGTYWNPTPGMYTRFGDVRELIGQVDDRLVIMGAGDEMLLRFDANALPAPHAGWSRDFILKVDGWAKDRDPNTAFSTSVEPLPFHKMSRYPYPETEHFPADPTHDEYRHGYNTRPALRLIRPLN